MKNVEYEVGDIVATIQLHHNVIFQILEYNISKTRATIIRTLDKDGQFGQPFDVWIPIDNSWCRPILVRSG